MGFNGRERNFLDGLWRRSAGLPEELPKPKKMPSLDKLRRSEWCPEFEELMRNRLIMGAFRYAPIEEQDFSSYDLVNECKKRLDRYREGKNLECLVDAANMLLLKFYHERKNGGVFEAVDDGEHSVKIK